MVILRVEIVCNVKYQGAAFFFTEDQSEVNRVSQNLQPSL